MNLNYVKVYLHMTINSNWVDFYYSFVTLWILISYNFKIHKICHLNNVYGLQNIKNNTVPNG